MVLRSVLVSAAEAIVLALVVVDRLFDPTWTGPARAAGTAAVVVCAIIAAAVPYQTWSVTEPRSNVLTVGMVGGLIGGAALTASVIGSPSGTLFGSLPLALLGLVGVVMAAVTIRLDARARRTGS